MRKVQIGGSMKALVATGPFENQDVFFSFSESIEGDFTDEQLVAIQKEKFKKLCTDPIEFMEKELSIKAVEKEFKHLRILQCPKCGKKHPSITTVRDFDSKGFYCTDEQLSIAMALGSIQDIRCRNYVSTGKWLKAKEIEACWPHLMAIKGKNADPNAFDFEGFLKKYPIIDMKNGERMWDCENEITFEPDMFGTPQGKWADNEPSVFDYKRNVDKMSAFIQMSISAKMLGLKQMIAIPVNGETEQGFSKPVISRDVEGYFEIAKDKRRNFMKRYGI